MKLSNYLASLLPGFSKDRITEDCRITAAELREYTIPAYKAAEVFHKGWKFKSPEITGLMDTFGNMVKGGGSMFAAIDGGFKVMLENLTEVEGLVIKTYNEEISGAGLTYMKANLLQFVEAVAFVSKFSRKLLLYAAAAETAALDVDAPKLQDTMSKFETDWIRANFVSFCTAFTAVTGTPQNITTAISKIPDVVVTSENVATMSETIGEKTLDPFKLGLIPIWMNPIYHVRMAIAEWQVDRHNAAKEEKRLLELRILNLEMAKAGKADAKIQQQIDYHADRVRTLNFKIAKMEAKHE